MSRVVHRTPNKWICILFNDLSPMIPQNVQFSHFQGSTTLSHNSSSSTTAATAWGSTTSGIQGAGNTCCGCAEEGVLREFRRSVEQPSSLRKSLPQTEDPDGDIYGDLAARFR